MITNDNYLVPKKVPKYSCKKCDYFTSRRSQYQRHLATDKHKMITNDNKMITKSSKKVPKMHYCSCGRQYKYASNLSRHKKTCDKKFQTDDEEDEKSLNSDKMDKMLDIMREQQETLNKVIKKVGNTTNSHNKITFQLYLDNKCKDAQCLGDFTKNLTMTIEDLLAQRQIGFAGVGNVVVKNLQDMKMEDRPIHCTDVKKFQILYKK